MKPNPALPPGTWIVYRYTGIEEIARIVDIGSQHGCQLGYLPPIGAEVVRVVFKDDEPQPRQFLVYEGIKYDANLSPVFKFRKGQCK